MDIITKSHFEQFKNNMDMKKRKTVMLLNFFQYTALSQNT